MSQIDNTIHGTLIINGVHIPEGSRGEIDLSNTPAVIQLQLPDGEMENYTHNDGNFDNNSTYYAVLEHEDLEFKDPATAQTIVSYELE